MKKLLAVLAVWAFALTSCSLGGNKSEETTETPTAVENTEVPATENADVPAVENTETPAEETTEVTPTTEAPTPSTEATEVNTESTDSVEVTPTAEWTVTQ